MTEADATPQMTERKAEIVRIAAGLFAERGFDGASLRHIGDAVGMRRGSLYAHFDSKDEILGLVLGPALAALRETLDDAAASDGSGAERLRLAMERAVERCIEYRDAFLILFQDRMLIDEAPSLAHLSTQANAITPIWLSMIDAGQDDGSIRSDIAASSIALGIYALLMGALSDRHLGLEAATGQSLGTAADLAKVATTMLFEGITPD